MQAMFQFHSQEFEIFCSCKHILKYIYLAEIIRGRERLVFHLLVPSPLRPSDQG